VTVVQPVFPDKLRDKGLPLAECVFCLFLRLHPEYIMTGQVVPQAEEIAHPELLAVNQKSVVSLQTN